MTTEQELIEKLARFVNWNPQKISYINNPDFIHNIADCIDILGTKFDNVNIQKFNGLWYVGVKKNGERWGIAGGEDNPAMAFCRAVIKSIEQQAIDKGAK